MSTLGEIGSIARRPSCQGTCKVDDGGRRGGRERGASVAGYERGPRRPARACVCCDGPSVKPRVAPGYALSVENCTSHPSKHQSAAFACTPLGGGCGRFASVNAGQRHAEHLSLSEKNGARRRSGLGRLLRRALALRPACTRTAPPGTEAGVRNHESHTYSGRLCGAGGW